VLVIDGMGCGHPQAVELVSPGPHKFFVTASNGADKAREGEVATRQRASVEIVVHPFTAQPRRREGKAGHRRNAK